MARATRNRTSRRRARPEPSGPVGVTASRVRDLAVRVRDHQETSEHIAALQQRIDQLDALATRLQDLLSAARVLKKAGAVLPVPRELRTAKQTVLDLKERYQRDPQSVRRAQPAGLESPIRPLDEALQKSWKELATPRPGAVALAQLLGRFPLFREAQIEIAELCEKLEGKASALPRSEDDHTRVVDLNQQLRDRIEALEGDGMDSDVQRFLRGTARGVPLDQLLREPHVLDFLRTHDLLPSLTVSFRPNSEVPR